MLSVKSSIWLDEELTHLEQLKDEKSLKDSYQKNQEALDKNFDDLNLINQRRGKLV